MVPPNYCHWRIFAGTVESGIAAMADRLLSFAIVANLSFDRFVDLMQKQRKDLERQMEDTDASHVRTSDLLKSIEDLRERVRKTASGERASGPQAPDVPSGD